MPEQQSYKNHVRVDQAYLALQVLNLTLFVTAIVELVRHYDTLHWLLLGLALAVLSLGAATRRYALKNQNRIIRLEENVRLHHLGVNPSGLNMQQMIALRFASDAETPALAMRAANERLTAKQIKEAIVSWQPDLERV